MSWLKTILHYSPWLAVPVLLWSVWLFAPSEPATQVAPDTETKTVDVTSLEADRVEAELERQQQNESLQILIEEWVNQQSGEFSVVVEELTGQNRFAAVSADKQVISASTYKLFFVYAVLHEVESGNLTLESKTSLGRTVLDCIDSLLTYSWDVCGFPFAQLVGLEELDQLLIETGFKDTDLTNYNSKGEFIGDKYSTAADEALFMKLLYNQELLGLENTQLMIEFLTDQVWRERIPAGVPDGVEVADKPGWLYEIENDTAIVFGPVSDYVLVIMSDNSTPEKLAELSSLIYEFLQT